MRIKLVYVNGFESSFRDTTYYISQFIDPQTLNIINFSSTSPNIAGQLDVGNEYDCILTIKKNKLSIESIKL